MSRLPSLRPREVLRGLEKAGFVINRVRGSHYQLLNPQTGRRVTVPFHTGDLSRATVTSIIQQAGLTAEAFLKLM